MTQPVETTARPRESAPVAVVAGDRRRTELDMFRRKVLFVVFVALALILLWQVRRVVILIFIAATLAAGITPVVRRVRTIFRLYLGRRIHRGPAVLIVYLPFLLGAVLFMIFGLPNLIAEGRQLGAELPKLVEQKILIPMEDVVPTGRIREYMKGHSLVDEVPLFPYLRGAVTFVSSSVAVLVLVVYMLVDAERIRNLFLLAFPEEDRASKKATIRRMSKRMSAWLSGQLLLASIIGIATFVALSLLRVPYAFPLAVVAAIGEMVPIIGPIVGAVPALIVALFQSTWQFWAVLIVAVLIQQVENLFLVPRVMGKRVSVPALAVFIGFMMGGTLLGILGAVLAIPFVAIVQVAFEESFIAPRERRQIDRPGSLAPGPDGQ